MPSVQTSNRDPEAHAHAHSHSFSPLLLRGLASTHGKLVSKAHSLPELWAKGGQEADSSELGLQVLEDDRLPKP